MFLTFTLTYLASYFSMVYITLLWGHTQEKKINFNLVLKEPALYNHLLKGESSIFVIAILITPFMYFICLTLFIFLTSLIFGIYTVDSKGRNMDIHDWYIMLVSITPVIIFIYAYVRSKLLVHCTVCKGTGVLSEYNSYLERTFDEDTCFCCQGEKVVKKLSQQGKTHKLLIENLTLLEQKSNGLEKSERRLAKLEYEFDNESHRDKNHLLKSKQRIEEQISFEEVSINFHKLTVSKLMILLYKSYMANYILKRNKELEKQIDENVSTFVDIEMKKDGFGTDREMVFKIESLVQEISMSQELSTSLALQSKLEQLTQNITIEK